MRIVLDVPEAVAVAYDEQTVGAKGLTAEHFMVEALRSMARVPVTERHMVLAAPHLAEIDKMAGLGNARNPDELVERVGRLASLKIGDINVAWTPGQLEELARRAGKNGRTPQEEAERVVRDLSYQFFDAV